MKTLDEYPEHLKFHSISVSENTAAVYCDIILKDASGALFEMGASSFKFDLRPVGGNKKKEKV